MALLQVDMRLSKYEPQTTHRKREAAGVLSRFDSLIMPSFPELALEETKDLYRGAYSYLAKLLTEDLCHRKKKAAKTQTSTQDPSELITPENKGI